jgi:nucleoside-diphosphate-sugar epimerase
MNVVITGAAGFLGKRLIRALLDRPELRNAEGRLMPVTRIKAFDQVPLADIEDSRLEIVVGDLRDLKTAESLVDEGTSSIFHLAAVVSSDAETNFDLGMELNFDATRAILQRVRALGTGATRFVTMSSVAVFGGALPPVVPDDHVWMPQSSYGTEKAMADLLLADYSRRGYVDGRSLRLPTIAVRAGRPNKAASSFVSSIIREPLHGYTATCPVDPATTLWIMSPRYAVQNILHGHDLASVALSQGRVLNLPGLSISVREMIEALRQVAGDTVADRIRFETAPEIERIVGSWPGNFSADYARSLNFERNVDFISMIEEYLEENLPDTVSERR